jgi:hypothetical protein
MLGLQTWAATPGSKQYISHIHTYIYIYTHTHTYIHIHICSSRDEHRALHMQGKHCTTEQHPELLNSIFWRIDFTFQNILMNSNLLYLT